MNCLNHPDVAAAAYCQNCGKPLCTACIRSVGGVVYCEPCLAARLSGQPGAAEANLTGLHAHPVLAGLLGFIPGVGAMYNGQFVKALAHVLIFAVFVSLSDKSFVFGLLVAAWVFYQVFDAAQTAKARRDGLPLPNPFGLNDLGTRLGMAPPPASAPTSPALPLPLASSVPGGANPNPDPIATIQVLGRPLPAATRLHCVLCRAPNLRHRRPGNAAWLYGTARHRTRGQRHPFGAIVLIVIGLLLLLHTLGIFEDEWIGRAWPHHHHRRRRLAALPQNPRSSRRRCAMNSWLLIRRLRGPAFLILVGITALLNQWGVLSFGRSWPLYLILAGVIGLAERAALIAALPSLPSIPGAYAPSTYSQGTPVPPYTGISVLGRCRSRR